MNCLRKAINIITVLTVLCTCFSVLPAEAAMPNGLQDVYTIFTTGNAPSSTGPDTPSCKNGLAYASWSSTDFTLSYNGGTVGGLASPGIALAPVSYYPNGAFIEYAAAPGTDSNLHWMKVTANNSTLGSFRLTQLVVQGAGDGDPGTYNIIGTKVGGGTVETGNTAFDLYVSSAPLTIDLSTTPLAGQQLTSFEIDFTMTSPSSPRPADFTFQTFTVSNAKAPSTVTGISPTSGSTAGGTTVIITGTNFGGATVVKFGSTNATSFTVNTATQITATSPAGSAGTVDITVDGSATSASDQFTYIPPPTVTTGTATSITSTGATLNGTVNANGYSSTVTFDYGLTTGYGSSITASQSPVTGASNTAVSAAVSGLTCTTTYHFRAKGVSSGGTSNGSDATFTTGSCNSAPTNLTISISSINENVATNYTVGTLSTTDPDVGNTFTYTLVTGTGDTDNAAFNISGSSLRITTSPNYEAKNSYSVLVRSTDQGSLYIEKPFTITIVNVIETPAISSVSPTYGSAAGGSSVVITGTGLTGATAVKFGSTGAASFTVNSDTQITATSPAGLPGTVDITVTTPDGTSATGISDRFTFSASAASIAFDPNVTGKMYAGLDGAGVYASTNGGLTWAATGLLGNLRVKQLAVHPSTADRLYAATYGGGVFTSANSGGSWSACTNAASGSQNALSLAIDSAGKLYAGTEGGIFSSTDCSVWSDISSGLIVSAAKPPVVIAIDPVTPSTLFAGLDGGGLYKKTSSTNWTTVTDISSSSKVKAIVINIKNSANLYAAVYADNVYKSTNSGNNWSPCTAPGDTKLLSLEIDGNGYIYAGTEAGVFVSSNGCVSWTEMNNGLPN